VTKQWTLDTARYRILALYDAGMYTRALLLADEALAAFPDDAWLHAVRADLLAETDRSDLAVPAARYAISLAPDMGYAHRVLADALIDSNTPARLAVQAATEAVRLEPSDAAYYTLVRALICRRGGTRQAAEVARTLAQEYPHSVLAPLALALVAIRRSGILTGYRWWAVVLVIIATQGGALIAYAVIWVINAIRRVPFLKQADTHLRRALEMDPSSRVARLLAAEVLRARYRFAQAVDHQVAVGALNAQLIDASEVVGRIGRRVAMAVWVAYLVWTVAGFIFHDQLAGAISGPAVAAAAAVLVAELRRRQSRALPPALRPTLDRQIFPVVAAAAVATLVVLTAWAAHALDTSYRGGSVISAGIAVAGLVATVGVFVRGRRSLV
jgi:hypothetical protein